ncbi:PAS domain S-box-containing protein [Sporomusa sp. KB1]|nr:PAS domain S-box-containing protein [Sporomusa sp. KB1]
MNHASLAILCAVAGMFCMILAYSYLYVLYRERYMGIWIITWVAFSVRLLLFDSGMLDWKQSLTGFIIFQITYNSTILLFLWGQYLFVGRPFNRWWVYGATAVTVISITAAFLDLPFLFKHAFPAMFAGIILITIGRSFIYDLKIKGIGNRITGYAFILWGLLTASTLYTLGLGLPWITSANYAIGGILRLVIASGTLIVYFEKTRADLLEREAYFRLLTEGAVDIIYRYRLFPEPKLEYISPSILPITGYSAGEYYDDAGLLRSLIHPDDLPVYEAFINATGEYSSLPLSLRLISKDNHIIWIENKCVSHYDEKGNLLYLDGIIRDVTARKELERLATRVDKLNMAGVMAASVAHEIRNPLTTVSGYLQIMAREAELHKYENRLVLMLEELNRANTIISEYLLLAKDKRIELKNHCLNTLIKKISPLIEADAAAVNVAVSLKLQELPTLALDENEIRQLILNLVRNGLEAMPRGGILVIGTSFEKKKVVLWVQDQGIGMPEDILQNLGTPFLTTKDTGTGLGLPICYRIATRHHATIDVKTGNQGTTFLIHFSLSHFVA